jgi:hypothetical protein
MDLAQREMYNMEKQLKTELRGVNSELSLIQLCNDVREIIGDSPTIVEIGSYMGESSLVFAQQFPDGKIICIDPWLGGFDDSDSISHSDYRDVEEQFNLRQNLVKNIEKIKGYSIDYKIDCDMVYIDGCHKYDCVKQDINHWLPLSKHIISGHDYATEYDISMYPHIADVKVVVNEILGVPDKIYNDGSWFKKK